ncbi:hypothetical protein BDQ12DRAFT_668502 [Crucibulum laeve]|uniref:Uncharacterized protein n=1 Tax=Crucibulum laeve TaxID=68775 RepID=A0A5C3LTI8_9AGAR|nr:hypothetical protein BDQ12DRAFT_668502 [Crucibulum laeve]
MVPTRNISLCLLLFSIRLMPRWIMGEDEVISNFQGYLCLMDGGMYDSGKILTFIPSGRYCTDFGKTSCVCSLRQGVDLIWPFAVIAMHSLVTLLYFLAFILTIFFDILRYTPQAPNSSRLTQQST